jgi:signal transduction histidine kinase
LKAVKSDAGAIHLLDKRGETLRLAAQQGLPEKTSALLEKIDVRENTLAGWVVRHNELLLIPDMRTDDRAASIAALSDHAVLLAVPIVANEQVRGVLTVLGDDLGHYTAQVEMDLVTSVGEQLGVVVENARLRQQMEELVVMEERNRLARELHDSVTQSLYSVTLFAEAGINLNEAGEYERAGQLFPDILETGRQALKEMRLLVHKLRPSALEKEGFAKAIQHRLNAVEGRAGIKHQLIVHGDLDMSQEIEETIFHVTQEALNNAIKHANADTVRVELRQDRYGLTLIVADNGLGFDLQAAAEGSGLGLVSMRERVEELGGSIAYESAPGQGALIRVQLPAGATGATDE